MSLIAKDGGDSDIEIIPQGTHAAVCSAIYDIGSQKKTFKDKDKILHEIVIEWQIPSIRIEIDGKDLPRLYTRTYTLSLDTRANLTKLLTSWRGKAFTAVQLEGFDVSDIVGKCCNLQIIHGAGTGNNASKTYANLGSIMKMMDGQEKPKVEGEMVIFNMDTTGPGGAIPETIPEWIQKKIRNSEEYKEAVETHVQQPTTEDGGPASNETLEEEDVPF